MALPVDARVTITNDAVARFPDMRGLKGDVVGQSRQPGKVVGRWDLYQVPEGLTLGRFSNHL